MKRALQNIVTQLVPVYREMNHYKRVPSKRACEFFRIPLK